MQACPQPSVGPGSGPFTPVKASARASAKVSAKASAKVSAKASEGVRVALRVTPGAARTALSGLAEMAGGGYSLRVTVTVVAEGGRANDAVIKFLAKTWGMAKSRLTLVAGHTDRNKIIHVSGNPDTLMSHLTSFLPQERQS